jgi:uncharacterized protein (UPF0335 family)
MKFERAAILSVVALFLLILFTYARFNHLEQRMTWQKMEGLNLRLDSLIATLRDSDARTRSYSEDLKKLQERVELMESEKKDLWAKLDNISRDLEGFRASVVATNANMDTGKKIVELGSISVKKHEQAKK